MKKITSIEPRCQTLGHGENLNLTLPVQIPPHHPSKGQIPQPGEGVVKF